MDPITLGLIGAGVGMAKTQLIDAPQARKQRELQAKTALYSPWTGMKPENVQSPNAFGEALGSGMSFYQQGVKGQEADAAKAANAEDLAMKKEQYGRQGDLLKAQTNYYDTLSKNPQMMRQMVGGGF